MRRFSSLVFSLTIIVLSILSYWGDRSFAQGQQSDDKAKIGGIYRAPLLNNPPTLDPAYVQDIYGIAVAQQLFDGLVRFSPDLYVIPALAENWQVESQGKSYRFSLRKDAQFHNGQPVTADDVVFSLSRLLRVDPPPTILPHLLRIDGAKDYREHKTDQVRGFTIVDSHTLVINLEKPYAPFLVALGMYQAAIVPTKLVREDEKAFGHNPLGSGPFKFVNWLENKEIRLERFAQYYAGPSRLDGIEYVIYPGIGVENVWADFERGRLDEMPVYGAIREKLKDKKDLQWIHRPSLSLQFYGINCQHLRLRDPELRAALSLALNREGLVSEVLNDQFEVARTILPPGLPGYNPQNDSVLYNLEAAREHLKRAVENSNEIPTIEIVSNSQSPVAKAELAYVKKCWAQLGINLEEKFIPDWSEFEKYLQSDSMQIYRYAWFADIPDPDDFLRILFSSDSPVNFMRYRNAEVDEMLQKAVGTVDQIQRAQMYSSIEKDIMKSFPLIPIIYLSIDYVYQPNVEGVHVSALGTQNMSLHRVWLKEKSPK